MKFSVSMMPWLLSSGLVVPCVAQQPAITVTTASSATTTATINGITTSDLTPPGTSETSGVTWSTLYAGNDYCAAAASWIGYAWSTEVRAEFDVECVITTQLPASARTGPNEYLVEVTADATAPALLWITRETITTAGAVTPFAQLDYGNDGTIDVPDIPATGAAIPVQLGSQPLVLRVIVGASLTGTGRASTRVGMSLLPDNDLNVTRAALGCSPHALELLPVFEQRGLLYRLPFGVGNPGVAVFGTSVQPALLPSSAIGPCLLVPAPEVLVLMPDPILLPLELPDTIRPFTIWTQVALLAATGVELTDAYRVDGW